MRATSFYLDLLAACAAAGSAGFWWAAALVSFPKEIDLTSESHALREIVDTLIDQNTWSRYGAAYGGLAIGLHALSVIARHIKR